MSGLINMKKRLDYYGGKTFDGRIVSDKYKSFKSALKSYQGEWITFKGKKFRCLINPDKQTMEYDQKEISINFDAEMHLGDVFYWDRTNSYWICYLEKLEEEAYFRAQIRQCDYFIEIDGYKYWIYTRGPLETSIIWTHKHNIAMNDTNYSMMFYIQKTEETNSFLKRFQKLKFDGHNWEVAVVDRYSQPGMIKVYMDETFDNPMEDAMVEIKPTEIELGVPHITGPQIVKPFDTNLVYLIVGHEGGEFLLESDKAKIVKNNSQFCEVEVLTGKSGNFYLTYVKDEMIVALFEVVIGSL